MDLPGVQHDPVDGHPEPGRRGLNRRPPGALDHCVRDHHDAGRTDPLDGGCEPIGRVADHVDRVAAAP